jgi:hypothetical protein
VAHIVAKYKDTLVFHLALGAQRLGAVAPAHVARVMGLTALSFHDVASGLGLVTLSGSTRCTTFKDEPMLGYFICSLSFSQPRDMFLVFRSYAFGFG